MALLAEEDERYYTATTCDQDFEPWIIISSDPLFKLGLNKAEDVLNPDVQRTDTQTQPGMSRIASDVSIKGAIKLMRDLIKFRGGSARDDTMRTATEQTKRIDYQTTIPIYEMTHIPKGVCIIINNQEFLCTDLDPRVGSDIDRENLKETFTWLGFDVKCHNNLRGSEMIWTLVDVAHNTNRYNHKNYDCFVCCILTHGELNHLYGSDGQLIPLTDLTNNINVNRCPGLAGKPKLFFLQACQGGKPMGEGKVLKSDSRRSLEDIEHLAEYSFFPKRADKQEFSPKSDLVHDDLPSAGCRADLVSALGFVKGRRRKPHI
ncbi:hypothetical protein DPMN_152563 [Dreissena polymorpha]|uniref:Caspase family p20 domain-containing protein n=1 Tax=Dreissena polymorpha TaxID=45954 RepID=A0A9D4FJS2_DREPO|nr:hypothetical protein DPMN_152563 [Dreissena polymorpha]